MSRLTSQILLALGIMTTVLLGGMIGFHTIEGWSLFDSFYMALITLTTVGYREIHTLSTPGRIFNSILMLTGVTAIFASIAIVGDVIIKLELVDFFGRRRRQKMVQKLSDHYIVCGAGRVGRGVIAELLRNRAPVVLIDISPDHLQWASEQGIPTVIADATQDATLRNAGIASAKGLVSALPSDAQNVYVTLSARVLNPKILISSRASDEEAEEKLRRAGATTVFTPYTFIGHRLAQSMLRPHVVSFLDVASAFGRAAGLDIEVEEVLVSESSSIAAKTLERSRIRQDFGVIVLAITKSKGEMKFNPPGDMTLGAGDVLIVMGERSNLKRLETEVET